MANENYFDGEWRPVTDYSFKALDKLRNRGFELGSDRYGNLMARWPVSPALTFTGIPLEYWREEVRLDCKVSLARLRSICVNRGADYDRTVAQLREEHDHGTYHPDHRAHRSETPKQYGDGANHRPAGATD